MYRIVPYDTVLDGTCTCRTVPFRTFALPCIMVQYGKKCTFINISDQAKNDKMQVVGGWEFELEKRKLAKIAKLYGVSTI